MGDEVLVAQHHGAIVVVPTTYLLGCEISVQVPERVLGRALALHFAVDSRPQAFVGVCNCPGISDQVHHIGRDIRQRSEQGADCRHL